MKKLIEGYGGSRVNPGIVMLLVLLTLLVSMSVQAQTSNLPTSEYPAKGEWKVMNPSTFLGTTDSAVEQCLRAVKADSTGRLTADKCQQFATKLEVGLCEIVTVPDGVVHDFMSQRVGGKSTLLHNVEKHIGRNDRALLCDLGEGVYAYWYTGEHTSCNNVGITLAKVVAPEPVVIPPVVTPAVQPVRVTCRFETREVIRTPSTLTHVPDFTSCGCYIPGFTGMMQGGIQTSSGMVCN